MLFTTLLLPLLASAAIMKERDTASPQAANVVVEKLEPKIRKGAQRARFKVGRKYYPTSTKKPLLISHSIYTQRGFDQ